MAKKTEDKKFPFLSMRISQASDSTGLSERYIWEAIRKKELPVIKPSRRITLILVEDLERWLESQKKATK